MRTRGTRRAVPIASVVVAIMAFGCTPKPATRQVVIRAFAFTPATDSVRVGDTVLWTNQDVVPHTATSRSGGFDSGTLEAGQAWRYTASAAGTFAYECTLHPTMKGTLVVH